jgi:Flp pilus assembly protein TadG
MSNSEMLFVIELVLFISLVFQIGYLMFVYRALKRMSKAINTMADLLVAQIEQKNRTLRKVIGNDFD